MPFTLIRLISGAVLLAILVRPSLQEIERGKAGMQSALSLSIYAFAFSWAYVAMDTGMGALILFATIQIVLNIIAQLTGDKINRLTLLGIAIAFTGLVVLLLPGQSAPDFSSALIMMVAGLEFTSTT